MIAAMSQTLDSQARLATRLGLPGPRLYPGLTAGASGPVFIKRLPSADHARAEQDGLEALRGAGLVVPEVYGMAEDPGGEAWLALQGLTLHSLPAGRAEEVAAALLAWHQAAPASGYGWGRDNYIGATVQPNRGHADWADFFAGQRLAPQLAMARARLAPAASDRVESVLACLPALLAGHGPPVRLHGDLWRGNIGWTGGAVAVFDPAVYNGPAEVDLAMLQLFGEPLPGLVTAYLRLADLSGPGYFLRRRVYDLYHLLNHFNLFGASWQQGVMDCCDQLLAEVSG